MAIYSKTAPRLLSDLLQYDPRQPSSSFFQPNYRRSCQHDYTINQSRSTLPYQDGRPGPNTIWTVSCICQHCRCHLYLKIDFTIGTPLDRTCPSPSFPLHHFEYKVNQLQELEADHSFKFECSAPQCPAVLQFRVHAPIIRPEEVDRFTNHNASKARLAAAKRLQPDREFLGFGNVQPIEGLANLRTYVHDSLQGKDGKRFSAGNKKFMITLGDDFKDLILRLGFTFSEPESANDYGFWNLPQPHRIVDADAAAAQRALLEDVKEELTVLMLQRPEAERRPHGENLRRPPPSTVELMRLLGTLEYEKVMLSRRNPNLSDQSTLPYFGLGALEDFSDRLIIFAYDRQVACAPNSSHIFLGFLQDMANIRNSEMLKVKVTMLISKGEISSKDVDRAYQHFGFDVNNKSVLTDEYILSVYQSRVPDVSPREQLELRRSLRIIGETMPSSLLKDAAAETVETYQQALSWLGAQEDTDDEFITTMLASKIADRPEDQFLGRKAVEIIAKARNSMGLIEYLRTGAIEAQSMSPQSAWRILSPDADMDVSEIDPVWVRMIVENRITDYPSRRNEWLKAAEVIAQERDSPELAQFLRNEGMDYSGAQPKIDLSEPYLFTIKPVRDLAVHYDDYQEANKPDDLATKKVNEALVKQDEVQKGSLFYDQLQILFNDLITARAPFKASPEVTRLALGLPMAGTPVPKENVSYPEIIIHPPVDSERSNEPLTPSTINEIEMVDTSADSDSTLQDPSIQAMQQIDPNNPVSKNEAAEMHIDEVSSSKVNLDLREMDNSSAPTDNTSNLGQPPSSPPDTHSGSSIPAQANSPDDLSAMDSNTTPIETPPTPPSDDDDDEKMAEATPVLPQLPPRPQDGAANEETSDEFRRQQDAQEVLANVLPLLRFGLRQEGVDAGGEQIDLVTKLLFGEEKRTRTRLTGEATKIQYFNGFYCRTPPNPHTVYDLLDSYFDSAEFVDEKTGDSITEYNAICKMPPIIQLITSQVGYDREKGAFKMNSRLKLEEKIFFERYMDDADILRRRKQAWSLKEDLLRLQNARSEWSLSDDTANPDDYGAQTIQDTSDYLKSLLEPSPKSSNTPAEDLENASSDELAIDATLIDESIFSTLEQAAQDIRAEIDGIESEIKAKSEQLDNLFKDREEVAYALHAVFIHRGNARGGHYWIYIHDAKENKWRKYNDEYVTVIPESQKKIILDPNPESEGTASLVVYIREDERDRLIETVCRKADEDPNESSQTEALDEEMLEPKETETAETLTYPGAFAAIGSWDSRESRSTDNW